MTESVPEIKLTKDILNKYFKNNCLNVFRELKEDIGKVKKMKYEQNSNISKETENLRDRDKFLSWKIQSLKF